MHHPLGHWWSQKPGSFPHSAQCSEFLLGSHCVGMIDWITDHGLAWSLAPLPFWRSGWLKVPKLSSYSRFFWWPTPILSHLISYHELRCDPRDSWITKTLLLIGKLQGFSLPPRNQGQKLVKFFIIQEDDSTKYACLLVRAKSEVFTAMHLLYTPSVCAPKWTWNRILESVIAVVVLFSSHTSVKPLTGFCDASV